MIARDGFRVHRLILSFWTALAFVGQGAAFLVFGPTLLDLARHLNVGVGVLSAMFGCRALGAGVGSVGTGVAMDKLTQYSYTMYAFIIFLSMSAMTVIPLSVDMYMLTFFMFLYGVSAGAINTGGHAILLRLWREKSGPCMQVVHFAFGFGAFTAPLIAKRFLSTKNLNRNNNCFVDTNAAISTLGSGCSQNETDTGIDSDTTFRVAYWISASLFLPTFLAYLFYSTKYDIRGKSFEKEINSLRNDSSNSVADNDSDWEEVELHYLDSKQDKDTRTTPSNKENKSFKSKKKIRMYNILIMTFLTIFMFVYDGMELMYGSLIFTVVVMGALSFSKSQAAIIQSLFWGAFAFARLFTIPLALFKVRSSIMMSGNLFGSIVAATIMISFTHNAPAIWLGSAILGMSYASIYPTAMTWMSENMEPTGMATAMLITGGVLGDITFPSAVGALVAKISPDTLFYVTFTGVLVSAVFISLMFLTAFLKKKALKTRTTSQFKKGDSKSVTKTGEEHVKLMDAEEDIEEESTIT